MQTRRLFFALWPGEAQQRDLAEAGRTAVLACRGRLTPSENFHVTLAFLGSVAAHRLPDVQRVADEVARMPPHLPIRLTFDRIEYWKKAKVLCATASASSSAAESLAQAVKSRLVAAGFTPDLKPFRAHVTLARKVPSGTHEQAMHSVRWSFSSWALAESRTGPAGSLYSVLHSWVLCGESAENP
jgi:RNA 2',3'-cyclic 3'-phosphodiesterase